MALVDPSDLSRFADFDILTTTYKTVSSHNITTDILIPKSLPASTKAPILLRYHGGGFIAGSSLYPGFFQPWHMELVKRHAAIIVSPNYRLYPETSIPEILVDVEDHWNWVHEHLDAFLEQQTKGRVGADTGRILTAGDSAGGYLSLMVGLSHADEIRASLAAYPPVDFQSDHFTQPTKTPTMGVAPVPISVLEDHLQKVRDGLAPAVVSEDSALERAPLMFSVSHNAQFKCAFPPENRETLLLGRVEDGARFPRGGVFVWHGADDTVAPVEGVVKLKEKMEAVDPELEFEVAVRPGDHIFDTEAKIDDEWMATGLRGPVAAWLK
ncbi:putative carboxylesterase 120 [Colletotrichum sidae]|uniref:Putative carboxylesterase 120 n=1 Tax=Colletotrichum sidae TaxID=1347389 RepID=A0A4R8TEF9_9PEZI|nr:putative carboxylesterase 120 [Colletotrichum sidae]